MTPRRWSFWAALALLAIAAGAAGWVSWLVGRDPAVPFLTRRPPAEWILYPTPPDMFARPAVQREAVFRRAFALERAPSSARLRMRAHRAGGVAVNGTPLDLPAASDADWKRMREADPTALLRPGVNEISVRVRSHFGPPALWLSVEGDGVAWRTDASWEVSLAGARWRAARLATTPMGRWTEDGPIPSGPRVLDSARRSLPVWLAFAAAAAAVLGSMRLRLRRRPAAPRRQASWLVGLATLLWTALMWSNARIESDELFGFDVAGHLEYIDYVLRRARLPLADEGWEMYQPPLYYAMAAGVVRSLGHVRLDVETLAILRALNLAGGLVLLGCLLGSLRLLFPARPRRWVSGFAVGAFLPAQLYMVQYLSNEAWAAAWAAAAFYVCLRILRRRDRSLGAHVLLGALLGAGMLTKFSLLIVVGVIVAVLAGRLAARAERAAVVWVRTLGALLLSAGLVSGWHFVRVAWRFGKPLVGNWDPVSGFSWWQDPGYHTAEYYTRFGRSLVEPFFSSFHSFGDGIYSTLWGDGLLGGSGQRDVRPPWNYDLMTAGYLLACLPTAAILGGIAAAVADVVRRPRAEWILLLGVLGATAFAIFVMTLRLPFHSQAKAFYGLGALVPASALAARGLDLLAGGSRAARLLLSVLLGTWALNACAAFWVRG
jgi:hypothetical protein